MLGRTIADPDGIEGPPAKVDGLGLLDVETTLSDEKRLEPVRGTTADGVPFSGYEMHMGVTEGPDRARPFARLADGSPDGAVSADGRVIGTYIHGLFADDRQRAAWLARFAAGPANIAYDDADRANARCARGASRRASRSRSPAQTGAMNSGGQDREHRDQDRVGAAIKRQRAADVGGIGVAAAAAHRGVVDAHAAIDARSGERQAERAGHRRFRIAGIGRAVARRVAPDRAPGRRSRRRVSAVAAAAMSNSAASRDAGRLTRSSSRAAAQPKAS